jgi:hypothetical protein
MILQAPLIGNRSDKNSSFQAVVYEPELSNHMDINFSSAPRQIPPEFFPTAAASDLFSCF